MPALLGEGLLQSRLFWNVQTTFRDLRHRFCLFLLLGAAPVFPLLSSGVVNVDSAWLGAQAPGLQYLSLCARSTWIACSMINA